MRCPKLRWVREQGLMVTRRSQASGGLADEARFGQACRWERVCTAAAQVAETARRARTKDLVVEHRQRRQPDSDIDKKKPN